MAADTILSAIFSLRDFFAAIQIQTYRVTFQDQVRGSYSQQVSSSEKCWTLFQNAGNY